MPYLVAGLYVVLTALLLAACATPGENFGRRATSLGFTQIRLKGDGFNHVAYVSPTLEHSDLLHVYVEHDGTPWFDVTHVAQDPTPRRPFALELMARDTGPRLLLGRPCYFEATMDPPCGPLLWTHRRYSPEVIASMVAALNDFLSFHPFRRVALIGYSGGGSLAWLMAARVPQAATVITVAANLDTEAWTRLHGYSALVGSVNPALSDPLPATIAQLHYIGGRDTNVPPSIADSFARRHPHARVVVRPDFDHVCCWIERWPTLLGELEPIQDSRR